MSDIICYGYTPQKWQSDVHQGIDNHPKGSIHIVKAKRQVGKSLLICNQLLKISLKYANFSTASYVLSPTLNQSRKIYEDIKNAVLDTPVIKKTNDSRLELVFYNNSRIYFKSAEQRDALRGITVTGILCIDEAAFIPDEAFYTILPAVDVFSSPILITSTPKFKQGFFYEYWKQSIQGTSGIFGYDINDYDTTMLLSLEKLEQYRSLLPKNQFQTEYLGEFLDGDSLLFGDFKSCITENITDEGEYGIGIDWGTGVGGDSTAISILDKSGHQVFRKSFNDIQPSAQVDYIVNLLKNWLPDTKKIVAERNSIGAVYGDYLRKALIQAGFSGKLDMFNTTNDSKNKLVNNTQVAIEQKRITLLNDKVQTLELSAYEGKVNPKTNTVSYNAPTGMHDDTVIALMLSLKAIQKTSYRVL